MKIAILSGKGGTGKTLVSVNLASVAENSTYIDCDVEEPNGHLFFKPNNILEEEVFVKIPHFNNELCNSCRKCVDFCKFNALAIIKNEVKIFDEVCHSCSGCKLICPQKAVTEATKNIGKICYGKHKNIAIKSGFLNIGNASGVPIIKKLLSKYENYTDENIFIDCPPGSACIVMESIKDADFCILVAEPTLFGAHNLQMVYELVTLFNKPCGVVLNKCIDKTNPSEEFCEENKIKIFAKIPFDKTLGKLNSDARILVDEDEKYKKMFLNLLYSIENEVQK